MNLSELLQIEMDFDALSIVEETNPEALKSIFDCFGVAMPEKCDIIRVTGTRFSERKNHSINFRLSKYWRHRPSSLAF